MSELLQAIKNLRNINFRHTTPTMPEIARIAEELSKKIDVVTELPKFELNKLADRWSKGDRDFTFREIRQLPFVIHDERLSVNDVAKILSLQNLDRERSLRNVIAAYLLNYDNSDKTNFLQRTIMQILGHNATKNDYYISKMLNRVHHAAEYIFSENCLQNTAKLYANRNDVNTALTEIGLQDSFYKSSNFVRASLINFFNNPVTTVSGQLKILDDINSESVVYKNIFPNIADALIRNVAACRDTQTMQRGKQTCLEVFYKNLGDPRIGSTRNRWSGVSTNSRNIFLQWLTEKYLKVFFEIIRITAVDRMWSYREKFWESYLPYLRNTWLFFGKDALVEARRLGDGIAYGRLEGGAANQSVLVFQIHDYVFTEWSHNGKLRVFRPNKSSATSAQNFFGKKSIRREVITDADVCVAEWIHSSPKTNSWQNRVSDWIWSQCGIHKNQYDWGLFK